MQAMSGLNQNAKSVFDGLMEEYRFVNDFMARRSLYEASQFGAAFYPSKMSWCPAQASSLSGSTQSWWPTPGVTIFSNLTATHSLPIMFNSHGEAAVSQATNGAVISIKVSNHPLDKTAWERSQMIRVSGILAAVMVMAAFGFIPASATYYAVYEVERDVKNQLIISGVSQGAYWLSNFVFDVFWGFLPSACAMVIFACFGMDAYIKPPGAGAAVALFIVFQPAMAGLAYLFSFLFSKSGNALIFSWLFNVCIGFLGTTTVSILANPGIKGTYNAAVAIRWILRFVPCFSLGYGFLTISVQQKPAKTRNVGALSGLGVGGTYCKPKNEVTGTYNDDYHCLHGWR
jgi:hypothetical protein